MRRSSWSSDGLHGGASRPRACFCCDERRQRRRRPARCRVTRLFDGARCLASIYASRPFFLRFARAPINLELGVASFRSSAGLAARISRGGFRTWTSQSRAAPAPDQPSVQQRVRVVWPGVVVLVPRRTWSAGGLLRRLAATFSDADGTRRPFEQTLSRRLRPVVRRRLAVHEGLDGLEEPGAIARRSHQDLRRGRSGAPAAALWTKRQPDRAAELDELGLIGEVRVGSVPSGASPQSKCHAIAST